MPKLWFDEERLREALRKMSRRSDLFRILREELSARGYWKNLPRGKPNAKYFYSREKLEVLKFPSRKNPEKRGGLCE